MKALKIVLGLFLLVASMGFLYRPNIIMKINEIGRDYIFNDVWVISHRWKVGVLLFVMSLIALYMGMSMPVAH
ncbi:MAG: hypothetical protein ABH868_05685 [bacterium]